ncbi:Creatinase/aminopeptidase [Dentipellis sp. KUC8613]|nr:Creatinase/aminopeptidase [Dentipellis sp. KUC8613]
MSFTHKQATSLLSDSSPSSRSIFAKAGVCRSRYLHVLNVCILLFATWRLSVALRSFVYPSLLSTDNATPFAHLASHCTNVTPIPTSEYHQRQKKLAETLHALNASAYIAEPGASALYYANISHTSWHLSERPLLLIISPEATEDADGLISVQPRILILTPSFEATRAKLLPIPITNASYPEWQEYQSPYQTAIGALDLPSLTFGDKIFVDGAVRHFIVDGLQHAAPAGTRVQSAPVEVRQLRERKSAKELEIMKCANEVTVLAIRAVREKLVVGSRESEGRELVRDALTAAGLQDLSLIVLFGENAALPHGSGTDRALGADDFVLIDCGGSLHGYQSDVTRTFALPRSSPDPEYVFLWITVHTAQEHALRAARAGALTRTVDKAARDVIAETGTAQYFTHRLGHGIGLEVHESPYLVGGSDDVIQTGHTFSDEPGIYIEGTVGVRLEDCFYIDEDENGVFLTAGVGGQAASPWAP